MPDSGGGGGGMGGGAGTYGMIIQAAGSALQAYAAWQDQLATAKAIREELMRQGRFQGNEFTQFEGGLHGQSAENAYTQMATGQGQREAGYNQIISGPQTTQRQTGAFGPSARDINYSQMTGARRAKLGGYSDWSLQQDIDRQRVAQSIADVADRSAADARLFPYQLYTAQHKWDEMSAAGSMIAGLGNANLSQYYSSPTMGGGGGGGYVMPNQAGNNWGRPGDYSNYGTGGVDYYVPAAINPQGEQINLPQYA